MIACFGIFVGILVIFFDRKFLIFPSFSLFFDKKMWYHKKKKKKSGTKKSGTTNFWP